MKKKLKKKQVSPKLLEFLTTERVGEIQEITMDIMASDEDIESVEQLTEKIICSLEYMRPKDYLPNNWEDIKSSVVKWVDENISQKYI